MFMGYTLILRILLFMVGGCIGTAKRNLKPSLDSMTTFDILITIYLSSDEVSLKRDVRLALIIMSKDSFSFRRAII